MSQIKDRYGNTYDQLVQFAVSGIVNSEPSRFAFEPEFFPPRIIKDAVTQVEQARGRKLDEYPQPVKVAAAVA